MGGIGLNSSRDVSMSKFSDIYICGIVDRRTSERWSRSTAGIECLATCEAIYLFDVE